MLFKTVVQRLRREGNNALEGTGHKVGTGDTAQQALGKIPGLKGVENIQQVFLEGVVLVYKGKSDKHITVDNLAGVIVVAAASVGVYKADVKRSLVLTAAAAGAMNVYYAVFQAVVSAVVIVKVQPVRLIKRALAVYLAADRLGLGELRPIVHQLIDCDTQSIADIHQRFDIDGNFSVFVFAYRCAAFVDDVCQLLQSKALLLAVFLDFAADIVLYIVQNNYLINKY